MIAGCELYIVPNLYQKNKGEKRSHLTVWVQNQQGWKNLLQMLTIANAEGFYYRPRIDTQLLLQHCEGLVVGSACASTWLKEVWADELLEGLLKRHIKVVLEVMPFVEEEQKKINTLMLQIADKYKLPVVATNDAHYIEKDDEVVQEAMLAIQSKANWDDPKRWKFNVHGLYMRNEQEMIEAFKEQNVLTRRQIQTAIKNTQYVVDLCKDFRIEQQKVELPRLPFLDDNISDRQFLSQLVDKGFQEKIVKKMPMQWTQYKERVDEEMQAIFDKGFERYFLMVWEMIKWANEHGIMTGPGRGSAGGSLVCYLLDITRVDPIKYNLLFSRFIDKERSDLPDIDSDYADKDIMRQHLDELYGIKNVAGISTYQYMKGRSAIRDVCRIFQIPYDFSDEVAKSVDDTDTVVSIEQTDVGRRFIKQYPMQYEIAKKLDGQIRGRGQHACGIVVSEDDLSNGDRVALVANKSDGKNLITNWDKNDIEYCGCMKVDVLGLSELLILQKAKELIEKKTNKPFVFDDIDLEDAECLKQFSLGNTVGCFQVGTQGLSEYCQKLGIDNFMMLSHATALYRPGPLQSGMAEDFIERKNKRQAWQLIHPKLAPFVGHTYGLIVYQEQVMQIVAEIAGLGWGVANKIRKVMAKSQGQEKMKEWENKFVEGCLQVGILNKRQAISMFEDFIKFGKYCFNIAHSVEYSHITFWDMYLKVYYPLEFYCASLSFCTEKNRQNLIDDAWKNGIEIRGPKIGKSKAKEWTIVDGKLYAPLSAIKGIGEKTAEKIENMNAPIEEKSQKQMGFFIKKEDIKKATTEKSLGRYKEILENIDAYTDKRITAQWARDKYEYFGFYLRRR
jgi:DNA polymerase-3 subunit alpha